MKISFIYIAQEILNKNHLIIGISPELFAHYNVHNVLHYIVGYIVYRYILALSA